MKSACVDIEGLKPGQTVWGFHPLYNDEKNVLYTFYMLYTAPISAIYKYNTAFQTVCVYVVCVCVCVCVVYVCARACVCVCVVPVC